MPGSPASCSRREPSAVVNELRLLSRDAFRARIAEALDLSTGDLETHDGAPAALDALQHLELEVALAEMCDGWVADRSDASIDELYHGYLTAMLDATTRPGRRRMSP